jgi:hypothetical protein
MASSPTLGSIQQRVWEGKLPLEITLSPSECRTYDQSDPYFVSILTSFSRGPLAFYIVNIMIDIFPTDLVSSVLAKQAPCFLLFLVY